MVQIPLGIQSYRRQDDIIPETKMINLYIEEIPPQNDGDPTQYVRFQRPGLAPFDEIVGGSGGITGMYRQDGIFNGDIFFTYNSNLYRRGVSITNLGPIGSSNMTRWASNIDHLAILTDTGLHLYDGSSIIDVTIPVDTPAHIPVDITSINGYFIIFCADGRWYWIVPGATTIDPLNFATAESSPDGGIGCIRVKDEVFFYGSSTIECWQPTGDADLILKNAAGRQYDKGVINRETIMAFDNSILWVGEDNRVYRADNVPIPISNYGIETRIKNRTGDLSALIFPLEGHLFYVLKIPGQGSFAYDAATRQWSEFQSYLLTEWRPSTTVTFDGITYCGDSLQGKLWTLDTERSNDDGSILQRIVTGTVEFNGKPVKVSNFSMYVGTSADCTFYVRWKDAQEDWPTDYEPLVARPHADVIGIFRCGNARQPLRTFEIKVEDDVKMRITWAKANELINNQN